MNGMDRSGAAPRYATGAIVLHWVTAAAFAFQIGLGWGMGGPRGSGTFANFQLHKSIGITILLLTCARIAWRLKSPPPAPPVTLRPVERHVAKVVHIGFYLLLLALPVSGWMLVSSSRVAISTFLYGVAPWPHVPGIAGLSLTTRTGIHDAASSAHVAMVWIALLAVALHVAGALKHQLVDRGNDMARMLPVPNHILTRVAIGIVVVFGALFIVGRGYYHAPVGHEASAVAPAVVPHASPIAKSSAAPVAVPSTLSTTKPVTEASKPAAAKSADWAVRMKASSIRFRTAWSQGPIEGGFGKWDAKIHFNPDDLTKSSATITMDMSSVTAANGDQQSALPGNDWFAVATHPTAIWRAARFRHLSGDRYLADGTLTLRGTARPLPVPFILTIAGDVATMSGIAKVDRTVFGVGQGEWASTADVPALVIVQIAIKADRVTDNQER